MRALKAIIHVNHDEHQRQHAGWMAAGLARHGITPIFGEFDVHQGGDVAVVWGWRQASVIRSCKEAGQPILVMERGHLGDRMFWTSVGWGGLGRRGTYADGKDGGDRFWQHFQISQETAGNKYVLVCGQVEGDAALGAQNPLTWARWVAGKLRERGHDVVYRPHPVIRRIGDEWCPDTARLSTNEDLAEDLRGARACVTFNSTAGVEAALAGYPVVAMDEGSMAWPVASHGPHESFRIPERSEREAWAHRLAWTQFSPDEIRSGFAWEAVFSVMPGRS